MHILPNRRLLQFSLRALLILTTAIACGCGWLVWKVKRAAQQRVIIAQLRQLQPRVFLEYAYEIDADGFHIRPKPSPGPTWLPHANDQEFWSFVRRIECIEIEPTPEDKWALGQVSDEDDEIERKAAQTESLVTGEDEDKIIRRGHDEYMGQQLASQAAARQKFLIKVCAVDGLQELRLHNPVNDADLQRIGGIASLQTLEIHAEEISDAGIVQLLAMPRLKRLSLSVDSLRVAEITPAKLESLARLPHLETLELWSFPFAEEAFRKMPIMPKLRTLSLCYVPIREDVLQWLKQLPQLRKLTVHQVIDDSLEARLRTALPHCRVTCFPPMVGRHEPKRPVGVALAR